MPAENFVIENLRLNELMLVVTANKSYYIEFELFLQSRGYPAVAAFINESDDEKALKTIKAFFDADFKALLVDGIARPYDTQTAKWYFMAWLLRDAPAQRLAPLLKSIDGANTKERRINMINALRKYVAPIFPLESWSWTATAEVFLARLEGSRRSLKGGLFENIVRNALRVVFDERELPLVIDEREVRLNDETYDVKVTGEKGCILLPVKTRETMGGGHANLFTRDIHKAITVAHKNGFECIPIVIAESWGGDLETLDCANKIYIQLNPNQVVLVEPILLKEFRSIVHVFAAVAGVPKPAQTDSQLNESLPTPGILD